MYYNWTTNRWMLLRFDALGACATFISMGEYKTRRVFSLDPALTLSSPIQPSLSTGVSVLGLQLWQSLQPNLSFKPCTVRRLSSRFEKGRRKTLVENAKLTTLLLS